ncbi:MAG TPA: flagellar hook protein [Clostridiales bacterium]|nr:MAG: hypothetical protein A2Y18_00160 [Clostridiales bacterium GWD2_32_19]HCC06921.1 flagellar hook protein [Clostridiales bacterium]
MSTNRITGLATGMDTETLVKGLMDAAKTPMIKLKQKRQLDVWRMEAYREMTSKMTALKSEYMNVLNQSTNMTSKSSYKVISSTRMDKITGLTSNAVDITTNAETSVANHTIKIDRLATAASAESTAGVTKDVQSSAVILDLNLSGKEFKINLDGIQKTITLNNYADMDALILDMNDKIKTAFGTGIDDVNGKIQVAETSVGSGMLKFTVGNGASVMVAQTADVIENDALAGLKLTAGDSNRLNASAKLGDLKTRFNTELTFGGVGLDELRFSINGSEEFVFDIDTTLSEMMSEVNANIKANVIMKYDEVNDKFTIESKTKGAGANIIINQTAGGFFGAVSNIAAASYSNGLDAKVTIDGQEILRNSNEFTVNNVGYKLKATTANTIDINMNIDTQKVYDNIKTFITKYNELIDNINLKTSEKYDRNYQPLTDDEREAMSDDDIVTWEKKAKTGLLKNDNILQSMVYKMRTAISEAVGGGTGLLASIGISTSGYEDKGKLVIDEIKLKAAIEGSPDKVADLFAKKSTTHPVYKRTLTLDERKIRYEEEGIANRLYDILEDNISTYRDANGKKGFLVEKAGIVGDASEATNFLTNQIIDYELDIADWEDRLADKEDGYYAKYAALEVAIQKMNTQSSYISNMLGGSSSGS